MHTAARTQAVTNHFKNIPLGERIINQDLSYLKGSVPHKVHEMIYDNGCYHTVVGLWPNGERVLDFKRIWAALEGKYGDRLLPLYFVVENGVLSNYLVVHFRKEDMAAGWDNNI